MRKLSLAILLSTILVVITNCKEETGDGEGISVMDFNSTDSMSRDTALMMINHYLDSTVDHDLDAIIKQIYLNSKDVKEMVKSNTVKRVKLLTAAYLPTHPTKQNQVTIIVQIKRVTGMDSTYRYYDIHSVTKSFAPSQPFCPPPNDCIGTIED